MHITFRKIGPYEVPRTTEDIRQLLLGRTDPSSAVIPPDVIIGHVYSSPRRRARTSVISDTLGIVPELDEVSFDPLAPDLQQTSPLTSTDVRQAFVHHWMQDTLSLSRYQIMNETRSLFRMLLQENRHATVISHTFRLKIIEGYIRFGDNVFTDRSLLAQTLDCSRRIFDFRQSFSANISHGSISRSNGPPRYDGGQMYKSINAL